METGKPPSITLYDDELTFSFPDVHPDAHLTMAFYRTLRVPDDGREYPMPAKLGRFPLNLVDEYLLPEVCKKRGGVFLPMFSREALVVDMGSGFPMAVKVAAGKINVVNGRPWTNTLDKQQQDYLISSHQHWLHGFNTEAGHAGQFVASPMGAGASVEEQLSGQAVWGGLQILVHPMKQAHYLRLLEERRREQREAKGVLFSMAPAQTTMGLAVGGRVRQVVVEDPWGFDAWDTTQQLRSFVHLLHAKDYPRLTGLDMPPTPVTARRYAEAGIPWYDWNTVDDGIGTQSAFASVQSASQLLSASNTVILGDQPVDVSDVIYLGRRIEPDEW